MKSYLTHLSKAPTKETNNRYVVDFRNEPKSLRDLFPELIDPTLMLQELWEYILKNNLLKQIT